MLRRIFVVLVLISVTFPSVGACAQEGAAVTISFKTAQGGSVEADFYDAGGARAVVFAHGAVFNKESWAIQAERLRESGVSGLSINFSGYGKSKSGEGGDRTDDLIAAIKELKTRGFKRIGLIGGSMGGAITLRALAKIDDPAVDKVILLAPAGGDPIASESIDKLFVVAEFDGLAGSVRNLHERSAEPKRIKVYSGGAHAQHIFKSEHADDLNALIVEFMKDAND